MKSFSRVRTTRSQVQHRLSLFLIPYGLLYLADGVLTYMLPIQLDTVLQSASLVGFIVATAAVASVGTDFLLPILFKRVVWLRLMKVGAVLALLFPSLTFMGLSWQSVPLLFLGSFISGVYFEFIGYGLNRFIEQTKTVEKVEKEWSVVSVFNSFSDFAAALVGNALLVLSILFSVWWLVPLQLLALVFLVVVYTQKEFSIKAEDKVVVKQSKSEVIASGKKEIKRINIKVLWKELIVFAGLIRQNLVLVMLFSAVWMFDALTWTFGGIWSAEKFGFEYAWFIVAVYQVCAVVGTSLLIKFPIIKNGSLYAAVSLVIANFFFLSMYWADSHWLFALLLIVGTIFFSVNFPLTETLLTRLAQKHEKQADEYIGLKRLVYSLSYIAAPAVGGLIGQRFGFPALFASFNLIFIVVFGGVVVELVRGKR